MGPRMDYASVVNKARGVKSMFAVPEVFKKRRVLGAALITGGLGAGALGLKTLKAKPEAKKKKTRKA